MWIGMGWDGMGMGMGMGKEGREGKMMHRP